VRGCYSQNIHFPALRFRALLNEAPEVELALV
jgi:hypothetical protein